MMIYEGSVKNLWATGPEVPGAAGRQELEFEYTDAYSVFDWGRMPDELPGKGAALAAIGAHFFEELAAPQSWKTLDADGLLGFYGKRAHGQDGTFAQIIEYELKLLKERGLPHHYLGRPQNNRLKVRRVAIEAPQASVVAGQNLYLYPKPHGPQSQSRLIPLEVVFRFGMPAGSSFGERLTSDYAASLGFSSLPQQGAFFPAPILEFFSKLEAKDRFLTWEQALNYGALTAPQLSTVVARTLLVAEFLRASFQRAGLELWDGKFEWALLDGEIALVDSIGPDELRLIEPRTGVQLSKEFLRQVYRRTDWYTQISQAKKKAESMGESDWKTLAVKEFGAMPPKLDAHAFKAAQSLYPSLAQVVTGQSMEGALPLRDLAERIATCLRG